MCVIAEISTSVITSLSLSYQPTTVDMSQNVKMIQLIDQVQNSCTALRDINNKMDVYLNNKDEQINYRANMAKEITRRYRITNKCEGTTIST